MSLDQLVHVEEGQVIFHWLSGGRELSVLAVYLRAYAASISPCLLTISLLLCVWWHCYTSILVCLGGCRDSSPHFDIPPSSMDPGVATFICLLLVCISWHFASHTMNIDRFHWWGGLFAAPLNNLRTPDSLPLALKLSECASPPLANFLNEPPDRGW